MADNQCYATPAQPLQRTVTSLWNTGARTAPPGLWPAHCGAQLLEPAGMRYPNEVGKRGWNGQHRPTPSAKCFTGLLSGGETLYGDQPGVIQAALIGIHPACFHPFAMLIDFTRYFAERGAVAIELMHLR